MGRTGAGVATSETKEIKNTSMSVTNTEIQTGNYHTFLYGSGEATFWYG